MLQDNRVFLLLVAVAVSHPLHGERVDVVGVLEEQVGEDDDAVLHAAVFVDPLEEALDRSSRLCG